MEVYRCAFFKVVCDFYFDHISPVRFDDRAWKLVVNKNTLNFNTIYIRAMSVVGSSQSRRHRPDTYLENMLLLQL